MLLSIIRQNQKLAAKRNPAFDRNRFAKFLIYFMVAFWAAYLIFIGVMLSFAFEDIFPSMEPYHIMNQGLIYLLILDFFATLHAATGHVARNQALSAYASKKE